MTETLGIAKPVAKPVIQVYSNSLMFIRYYNMGFPKGSILSPVIFKIYTIDFLSIHKKHIIFTLIQYTDDLSLYTENKDHINVVSILENSFTKWFFNSGFAISDNKMKMTKFTRHRICQNSSVTC